jgi:hypothetical protein
VKPSMKACVLGMVLAVCTVAANASGIDPSVIIRDPVGCPTNSAFGQNGAKIVLLATGGALSGIPNGNSFEIVLGCVNSICWPGGLQFDATANAVPEPATMALMLTGIGALVTRRKLRLKSAA